MRSQLRKMLELSRTRLEDADPCRSGRRWPRSSTSPFHVDKRARRSSAPPSTARRSPPRPVRLQPDLGDHRDLRIRASTGKSTSGAAPRSPERNQHQAQASEYARKRPEVAPTRMLSLFRLTKKAAGCQRTLPPKPHVAQARARKRSAGRRGRQRSTVTAANATCWPMIAQAPAPRRHRDGDHSRDERGDHLPQLERAEVHLLGQDRGLGTRPSRRS